MHNIYINGIGGLGNCLFQIAVGIYYREKYKNYKIILNKTPEILYGTSNMFGKTKCLQDKDGNFIDYSKTIFSKFSFAEKDSIIDNDHIILHNDFKDIIIELSKQNLLISNYYQHQNIFFPYLNKISDYLYLKDEKIINYIKSKYSNIENSICIGIRIGEDYKHMNKLTIDSYKKGLEYLKNIGVTINNIYIISDTLEVNKHGFNFLDYNCVEINESDIIQIYLAIMCKHFILSESSFHLWIAYIATINDLSKNVIYFKHTLTTACNLELSELKNWIGIEY
jgi:hypothetical protein